MIEYTDKNNELTLQRGQKNTWGRHLTSGRVKAIDPREKVRSKEVQGGTSRP